MKKLLIFCTLFLILLGCENSVTMFDQKKDECSDKRLIVESITTQNINQILQFDESGKVVGINMNYAIDPEDILEELSEYNRERVLQEEMIKANTNTRFVLYLLFFVIGIVTGRISYKRI